MSDAVFQIAWRNLVTGKTGLNPKRFGLDEGSKLVRELNDEYPDFEHTLVHEGEPPQFESSPIPPPAPFVALTDTCLMPFGEHKDKPMAQVPSDYLDYISGQDWIKTWPAVADYIERNRKSINEDLERDGRL